MIIKISRNLFHKRNVLLNVYFTENLIKDLAL